MTIYLRPATPNDAEDIAQLANIAGEGLPVALWKRKASSTETPMQVGARQAAKEGTDFSWDHATIAEVDGAVAGMMISYLTPDIAEPLTEDMHPLVRPLISLENRALETRYINVLATYANFRRQGVARQLMSKAEQDPGKNGMSIITTDCNLAGRHFYQSLGYREDAQAPVIRTDWDTKCQTWHLLRKP